MYPQKTIRLSTVEYYAAGFIFGFGLWVLSWGPDGSVSALAFSSLRASIESIGFGPPFRVLGLLGVSSGALYALGIKINGRGLMWTPIVRGMSCVLAVVFLVNLSLAISQIQPSSTGVYVYMSLAVGYTSLFIANLERFAQSLELIWGRLRGVDT